MKISARNIRLDAAKLRQAARLAAIIGLEDAQGRPLRADSRETAILARQLEYIKARTYDVKYPGFKARLFIPVSTETPPGAESITYRQWDQYSMAKVVANYADDLALVDVVAKEFTSKVKSLGNAFQYSVQDLRAAAFSGTPLDSLRASAARRGMESGLDEIAAFGLPEANMPGFLNHPNIPVVSPITGNWSGATPTQILADLNALVLAIIVNTKQVHAPDSLLLDTASFAALAQTPASATIPDKTILRVFLDTNPYIRNVDQWYKLDQADAAGTGPRVMAYQRDPEVVELEIPQEFEQFPPQARNLAFVVPCHMRVGGVTVRYPLAAAYMDGV